MAVLSETEMELSSEDVVHLKNGDNLQNDNRPNDSEKEVEPRKEVPRVRAMASWASVTALEERMSEKFAHLVQLITGLAGGIQKKSAIEDAPHIAGFSTTQDSDSDSFHRRSANTSPRDNLLKQNS